MHTDPEPRLLLFRGSEARLRYTECGTLNLRLPREGVHRGGDQDIVERHTCLHGGTGPPARTLTSFMNASMADPTCPYAPLPLPGRGSSAVGSLLSRWVLV